MEIKIAIVDDNESDLERLSGLIKEHFSGREEHTLCLNKYLRAEDLLGAVPESMPDIAFLDIELGPGSVIGGIELAGKLKAADEGILIVFQTTSPEYAFDALHLHSFDYLVKPCKKTDVDRILTESIKALSSDDPTITVGVARGDYEVPLRNIVAASSQGHSVLITLDGGRSLTSNDPFKDISSQLSSDGRFLLINRGIIINMDHVSAPLDEGMKMRTGDVYPIKVNGKSKILSDFSQYMISKINK